jgi:hypothetical protein
MEEYMSEKVLPPTVLEGVLLGLDLISLLIGTFLFFAIAHLWQERRTREEQEETPRNKAALRSFRRGLLSAAALSLLGAHLITRTYPSLPPPFHVVGPLSAWVLIVGLVCVLSYYRRLRIHLKEADATQYSLILWAATWVMVIWIIFFLFWLNQTGEELTLDRVSSESFAQYVNTFAQVAGILMAATMVVVTNRRNARHANDTARTEIYQTLECESIKLFRFENQNKDLVEVLWAAQAIPDGICDVKRFRLKEYTCQILNLFEMACRFRRKDIMEPDVFGSWVIWIWELCQQPAFRQQWRGDKRKEEEGIEYNYVLALRKLINIGLELADYSRHLEPLETRKIAFFIYAAEELASKNDYKKWLKPTEIDELEFARHLKSAREFREKAGRTPVEAEVA